MRVATSLMACVFLSGCIHIAPISRDGNKAEAITFAKLLRSLVPQMEDLLHEEQLTANDMKIMLDESAGKEFSLYQDKFDEMVSKFVAIRDKRQQIQLQIRQRSWQGALAHLIQLDALDEIQENVDRTTAWIQLAHNFRLRVVDFLRPKDPPELPLLSRSLESFLSEVQEQPMESQISSLRAEYRFKESDITP